MPDTGTVQPHTCKSNIMFVIIIIVIIIAIIFIIITTIIFVIVIIMIIIISDAHNIDGEMMRVYIIRWVDLIESVG